MSEKTQRYQVGGDHYSRHKIQPWDIIREYGLNFWEGNAVKYLVRRKPGVVRVEDLKKARHYLDELIAQEEAKAATELLARKTLTAAREAMRAELESDELARKERMVKASFYWGHHSEGQV